MIRAFQWDLARQTERWDWLAKQLPRYAEWGYQEVYLHLEDAVEFPSLPGVARKDAYSYRQMERLVNAARKVGIGVVPIVNLLGHTQYLIKVPELRELNELVGPEGRLLEKGQVCPLHPRMMEIADKLIGDMAPFCTAGKIHVGLDESYSLGRHPLSRAEVEAVGLAGHFGRYVQRLHGLVAARGLRMGIWADMLGLLPGAVKYLPRGTIAYDWYYYPFRRKPAMELHNFREYDLAPALRRQGVEYWGCPMSGPFRFEPMPTFGDRLGNLRSWWERCREVKAGGFLVTSWEPSRVAAPVVQAVEAAAAGLWLTPEVKSSESMLAHGFKKVMARDARSARAMAKAALAMDRYAYAGYFRWEIDEDWSFGAARGDGKQLKREAAFFRTLVKRGAKWPRAFAASVQLRAYLAERDAFVVNGMNDPKVAKRLKAMFAPAMRAAREMWLCSRKGSGSSPNLLAIQRDQLRLRALHNPPDASLRAAALAGIKTDLSLLSQQRGGAGVRAAVTATGANSLSKFLPASPGFRGAKDRARRPVMASKVGAASALIGETGSTAQLRRVKGGARSPVPIQSSASVDSTEENQGQDPALRTEQGAVLEAKDQNLSLKSGSSPGFRGAKDGARVWGGAIFRCLVHNFAPALQKVVLQQLEGDGQWRDLRGRFTIEFTSIGARRRAPALTRPFAVPVDGPGTYRLAVRGVGEVDISHVEILDPSGRVLFTADTARSRGRNRIRIGSPAPRSGFPALDWANNRGKMDLIHAENLESA